jgi:tetratricopeptide (TPR) repeat protein
MLSPTADAPSRTRAAIADYDAAIRLGITGSARLYTDRGLAKKRKSDHRGAVADFDRSLQCYLLPKENSAVLFERGACHQALHDPGRAASDFADAVGLDPDHDGARHALLLVQSSRTR